MNALSHVVVNGGARVDVHGEQHQARINPGQSKQVAEKRFALGTNDANEGDRGWRRQERLQATASGLWDSGQTAAWQKFSGGRRDTGRALGGSVEIDRGAALASRAEKVEIPQDASGWDKLNAAYRQAAQFEEKHRPAGTPSVARAFQTGPLRV